MATKKKSLLAAAGNAGGPLAIEDVFSTYLYTGNGSTQTITNGIDLAGEGGLVWLKDRNSGLSLPHGLTDTERGFNKLLVSNTTGAEITLTNLCITGFNSDGFGLGTNSNWNNNGTAFASWTFRKAPRFFDVVTYTGTGANQTIPHNLGCEVGSIFVKRTDSTANWFVQHRSTTNTDGLLYLNLTNAEANGFGTVWNGRATSTDFTVGTSTAANTNGASYVAYLFAHDPLGPSGDGSDGLIACGSYEEVTGANTEVTLGWEPQFVIKKAVDTVGDWVIHDSMRGIATGRDDARLRANDSSAENSSSDRIDLTSTGFINKPEFGAGTIIYIAIRRGPMRQPTSGTEVFDVKTGTDGNSVTVIQTSNGPVDMIIDGLTFSNTNKYVVLDRMRGADPYLNTTTTAAEATSLTTLTDTFQHNDGYKIGIFGSSGGIHWSWKRAPGFFDVVAYTGDGVAGRTVSHNLGVAPEMMIVKRRDASRLWGVYHSYLGNAQSITLNSTGGSFASSLWSSTSPTITDFTVDVNFTVNASGGKYIAYLFATLPGVSKVGSYTGNGTSQTINCGFTSGARFILIKRTDSSGDWYVWDTERGIVAANDPHLSLNTTAAEVTTDDSVDPDSSGFIVNQVSATNINVSSASYIFYAIA